NLLGTNATDSQWTWLESGPTCSTYFYTNQPGAAAFYVVGTPQDTDHDGLTDAFEWLVSKGNPNSQDSDYDGMRDDWEWLWGTDPWHDDAQMSGQRTAYSYDSAGRLKQVTGKRAETISVDGEGNIL